MTTMQVVPPHDVPEDCPVRSAIITEGRPGGHAGERSAYRDTVLLTSAAALIVAERADNLREGASMAAESIDRGYARAALQRMVEISRAAIPDEEEDG